MKLKAWSRRLLLIASATSPVWLVLLALFLHNFGDTWVARVLLYLPMGALGVPLGVLAICLVGARAWPYLAGPAVALGVLLFVLMGLVLPPLGGGRGDGPVLRVLSFNINTAGSGWGPVLEQIDAYHPDLVVLQEAKQGPSDALRSKYPFVEWSTQFIVASRFPLSEKLEPPQISVHGEHRSPRWIRFLVETPLGPIALCDVHPISPRQGMLGLRAGLTDSVVSGALIDGEKAGLLVSDGELRDLQIETFARQASQETIPVIVGADTNLPALSPALEHLAPFVDGFRAAGWGFGYTYPVGRRAPLAWMRLDRIYASPALGFVDFQVGDHKGVSDHRCVVADLQRVGPQ